MVLFFGDWCHALRMKREQVMYESRSGGHESGERLEGLNFAPVA